MSTTRDRIPPTQDLPSKPQPPPAPPVDHWAKSIEPWARGRASAELAAGLDPEQECRAWALDVAAYVMGDTSGTVVGVANHLIDLAEPLATWIRDGARP